MTESLRCNEPHEWRHQIGATLRRAADGLEFVVVEHVLQLGLASQDFEAGYALASRAIPHLVWSLPADRVDAQYSLVREPGYLVGKLNPTTWTVCHAAPGPSGLKHVLAQCDSRVAAQRLVVTLELERRA